MQTELFFQKKRIHLFGCAFFINFNDMNTNFELRPWQIADLENLVQYANNPNISKNLTNGFPHPYTEEVGASFG